MNKVGKTIVPTTIGELGSFQRPNGWESVTADPPVTLQRTRAAPAETTIWRVNAIVIGLRQERDGDYHLELQDDSGAMMIAEIPLPKAAFIGNSPFADDITAARSATDTKFGPTVEALAFAASSASNRLIPNEVSAQEQGGANAVAAIQKLDLQAMSADPATGVEFSMRVTATKAEVTGIGFFDKSHGQAGNAPNAPGSKDRLRVGDDQASPVTFA